MDVVPIYQLRSKIPLQIQLMVLINEDLSLNHGAYKGCGKLE